MASSSPPARSASMVCSSCLRPTAILLTGLPLTYCSWLSADCILAATGFETNFRPPFPIIGLNGVDLNTKWTADYAQTFGGVVIDDFPNFFLFMGPSSPVGQGSILSAIEMQSHYFSQLLDTIQESRIKTLSIKPERVEQYNIHLQSLMPVSGL